MAVGNLFFAWVTDSETFSATTHARSDLQVLRFERDLAENAFPLATVEIKNPGSGLLAMGFPYTSAGSDVITSGPRAFISYQPTPGATAVLLFDGILNGFPRGIGGETLEVEFMARPRDWLVRQQNFLDTLKVAPYFDPVLVGSTSQNRPEEVLAGYGAFLCWSPTSHDVIKSDILAGAAGVVDLTGKTLRDGLTATVGQPPVSSIFLTVETSWTQVGSGAADITSKIKSAFTEGTPNTLTPTAFEGSWPKQGQPLGSNNGYTVSKTMLNRVGDLNKTFYADTQEISGINASTQPTYDTVVDGWGGVVKAKVPRVWYDCQLTLDASYSQARTETVQLVLSNDVQPLSSGTAAQESLSLRTQDITGDPSTPPWQPSTLYTSGEYVFTGVYRYQCTADHTSSTLFSTDLAAGKWTLTTLLRAPIGNLGEATYFGQARGKQTIENAIMRARARLASSARCVQVSADLRFEDVVGITVDHSATIADPRLPGGTATGKVIRAAVGLDTSRGSYGQVTIACCIGNGTTPGIGSETTLTDDVAWTVASSSVYVPVACSPTLSVSSLVQSVEIKNQVSDQVSSVETARLGGTLATALDTSQSWTGLPWTTATAEQALAAVPTQIMFKLKSLAAYPMLYGRWTLSSTNGFPAPNGIDLAAASNSPTNHILLESGSILLDEAGQDLTKES